MDPILAEFKNDLDRIKELVTLLDLVKQFASHECTILETDADIFLSSSAKLHRNAKESNTGIVVLPGTLLLYLGGRFENYVRTIFEELCIMVASYAKSYDKLPKAMKENLIKFTAEIISNPRKYGHAENGVANFIKNLHININTKSIDTLNIQCLSITYENMRPDTLNELFERIGVKNIWDRIGEQPRLKMFFGTSDPSQTKSEARKTLNEFVETRNKIAHPSGEFNWPVHEKVVHYINFLEEIATAIKEITPVFALQLTENLRETTT